MLGKTIDFFTIFVIMLLENKKKQNVVLSQFLKESEVIHMLEQALFQLLILSLITNICLSFISFVLIIALCIIIHKKNRISAHH